MAGPACLADGFAALMLLTALYCAGRLVLTRTQRRPTEQDVDLVHVLMGVAMAGMLVPGVLPLPGLAQPGGALWGSIWGLAFGAATVWFAGRIALSYRATGRLRPAGSHHLPHLIMSGTMVYMLAMVDRPGQLPGAGMAASSGSTVHFPLLALILAQFMVGYVMWTADRLPALARVRGGRPGPAAATLAPVSLPTGRPATALATGHLADTTPADTAPADATPADATPADATPAVVSPAKANWAVPNPPLSPRLAACCNIAMGLVMGYMLIISW